MLPLRVASKMGEEGVPAVSSAFAVTFHNVLSTAQRPSAPMQEFRTIYRFRPAPKPGGPRSVAQATKARRVLRLAIIAVGVENSAFTTAKMRDYRAYEQ